MPNLRQNQKGAKCNSPVRFGIAVGTYGSLPYVHLQLEARRRFYPTIPCIVHDDNSNQKFALKSLCDRYECDFDSNDSTQGHHYGDLSVFVYGLAWAKTNRVDILLKVSRRWIFLIDWSISLNELVISSEYSSFSNAAKGFNLRTECIGLNVKSWGSERSLYGLLRKFADRGPLCVEDFLYEHCLTLESSNTTTLTKKGISISPKRYEPWPLLGSDRKQSSDSYLWHCFSAATDYHRYSKEWGLPYTLPDFQDPSFHLSQH
jgi:hypothetical protein